MLFPFELFFTKTVLFPTLMNPISEFLNFKLTANISILQFILFIWIIGSIICAFHFIRQLFISFRITKRLQKTSTPFDMSELFDSNKENYQVLVSDLVESPMVFGLKNIIFLPNVAFSNVDLINIVHHEVQHIKNYDVHIKLFLNVLLIIYWWFPPIYILKKNLDLFLEVRVDDQVTRNMSSTSRIDYTNSLVNVQKKIKTHHHYKAFTYNSFIDDSSYILTYRIHYLLDGDFIKKTRTLFLLMLFIIPILSNMLIFEPAYPNSEITKGTYSIEEVNAKSYITHKKDGNYILAFDGYDVFLGKSIPNDLKGVLIIEGSE